MPAEEPDGGPEANADPGTGEGRPFTYEAAHVIEHVIFLGSTMARRLDELDRRLEELASSLDWLRASLTEHGSDARSPAAPRTGAIPNAPVADAQAAEPTDPAPPAAPDSATVAEPASANTTEAVWLAENLRLDQRPADGQR